MANSEPADGPAWLTTAGEMAATLRTLDWSRSPLGKLQDWPPALRLAVNMCLESDAPAVVVWGPEHCQIFNAAYARFSAPDALGQDFRRCRAEDWGQLEPIFLAAQKGQATVLPERRFFPVEEGRKEERFFRESFRPIRDESGRVRGVYCSLVDTTAGVLSERRSTLLHSASKTIARPSSESDFGGRLVEALGSVAGNHPDLPFLLLYRLESEGRTARLWLNFGLAEETRLSPREIDLTAPEDEAWPLRQAQQEMRDIQVDHRTQGSAPVHAGPFPEAPEQAMVLPLRSEKGRAVAFLVVGCSPRRPLDESYREFFSRLRDLLKQALCAARLAETQAELKQREESYRSIVEAQSEMICLFRPDGDILFVNSAYAAARGTSPNALIGANFWDFVAPKDRATVRKTLDELRPEVPRLVVENCFETIRGPRWVLWANCALSFDDRGIATEIQASGTDITERKQFEQALRHSEESLQLALTGANAGLWSLDLESREVTCSEELPVIYGYHRSTTPDYQQWLSRVHPDDRRRLREGFLQRLKSNAREFQQEFRIIHPQRGLRWILDTGVIERNAEGRALRVHGINMDITERKKVEEALRDSEKSFRRLAEAVPTLVWVSDEEGSVSFVNQSWVDYTGQRPEEALGFGWINVIHPDDREPTREFWEHCRQTGELYEGEVRYRQADGQYRWHHFKALPRRDEQGNISGWYGAALDVEEHKRVEQALRDSEQYFRAMADTAPAMLWTTDPEGGCTFFSRNWYEYTGQQRAEALGGGWLRAVHPDDRESTVESIRHANSVREEFATDFRIRGADGDYRWAIGAGRPWFSDTGQFLGYVGSVIDVDERKKAEQILRESEERFRTLADNISQLAWMADPSGWIFWYNQRFLDYTGHSLEDLEGWGWTKVQHPDHLERVVKRIQHSWNTGEVWEDTFPLRGRDGDYRWFLSRALPIRDAQGRISRWFGTHTDVSQQRAAEDALKDADRRKDEFLATLAHELRNPLAPLRNGLEIMQLPNADPAVIEGAREMMERQLSHMVRLIDDLLDLSRISRGKITLHRQRLRLSEAIQQAIETSRPAIDLMNHQLTVSQPDEEVFMRADATRLAQIFSNLLNNAAKFTERGGCIWLTVQAEGKEVRVSVRDNGAGISPELLPHVFDMFTQGDPVLERTHGGLGIGLSLVKGLVEMHGGRVEARSDGAGLGSEFIVHLPIASAASVSSSSASERRAANGGRRRILVVDDNRDSAASMATMLELMGNETQIAHDGLEALGIAAGFRPDVVLLDIGMPKLNGYEVARKIRNEAWGRDMRLVALTGWGQEEDRRRSREAGFDVHLVKPVGMDSIASVLN